MFVLSVPMFVLSVPMFVLSGLGSQSPTLGLFFFWLRRFPQRMAYQPIPLSGAEIVYHAALFEIN